MAGLGWVGLLWWLGVVVWATVVMGLVLGKGQWGWPAVRVVGGLVGWLVVIRGTEAANPFHSVGSFYLTR